MSSTGRQYWRSLEQLAETPRFLEWLHREFPAHASEFTSGPSRRRMLQLMAASFGLAGLTACRRPVERILTASQGSEDVVPGAPSFYNTIMSLGGEASGLLVECHDGRPTKIEGNPNHPSSLGATSVYAQASVLSLYDPDRSKAVLKDGKPSSWEEFEKFAAARMGAGVGLRFLSEAVASPSLEAVRDHVLAHFPQSKWVEYEPLDCDQARAGAELAFKAPLVAQYHFDRADVVVSLDCDFLGQDAPTLSAIRAFTRRRRMDAPGDSMNRLYIVEGRHSMTGAVADHRLRMRPSEVRQFAEDLARELRLLSPPSAPDPRSKWLAALARDLESHRGRCLVVAGPRQPAEVHALAHWINQALGAVGVSVTYCEPPKRPALISLSSLAAEISAGQVETLVILGGNPVFNAPADLGLGALLRKVPISIRLGLEEDETSAVCSWHLPEAHFLESWSDGRAADGTASVQQPLIEPLYGGRTAAEVLALLSGYKDRRAYDIVHNYWLTRWSLADGVIPDTQFPEVKPVVDTARVQAALQVKPPVAAGVELAFYPGWASWDGRFANNGWLQEAPDPMTRLTWDNAALISPTTARALGLGDGELVVLSAGGREVTMPVLVQPGHADNCVSVAVGYGRSRCGRVGQNVGFNAYALRTSGARWIAAGVEIRKTGKNHKLALTQNHQSMEGRPLVLAATLEEYRKDSQVIAKAAPHDPGTLSLYKERSYDHGYQWAMSIDLNACVGCNTCVVACQAENNIPIVGKDQVLRGREMHWIRVDRYYEGSPEEARVVTQPVTCQQCENAPCENVCPVAATTHSPEGLNDMVYNRCVGTRYCSNNCPYKVRRFNFLNFHKEISEVGKMVFNPDVTVRMRGVMEKCTYCVQRIEQKRIQAQREGHRTIRDGEIVTACQQACPAEAIVFGNMNDSASRVSKLRKQDRRYDLLGELHTKPRTTYLAKLRNPNPELG
jgi:molybdopterin-containing oxidoreductase family iron-sulfur binding subunit